MKKRIVYVLISESDPDRHYIGLTSNLEKRLLWHNTGPKGQTRSHRPWRLSVSTEFADEVVAARFERYLKSGSGRTFAKRHFDPDREE